MLLCVLQKILLLCLSLLYDYSFTTIDNDPSLIFLFVIQIDFSFNCFRFLDETNCRGPGATVLIMSWIITLFTLWQMVEMHEMVPGVRFDRYHELGQHAFGEKLGLYIVVPQQLIVEVGTCIAYMVTGGKSLKKFHDTVCPTCKDIRTSYWILIFASVIFVLCQCPSFNSISAVSLAAAVMSIA